MRNFIVVNEQLPDLHVADLEIGEMFRYEGGDTDAVYMKCNQINLGNAIVYLNNGRIYTEYSALAKVIRVKSISISS